MNFDLSEEQELFCASVERFAAPIDVEARGKLRRSAGGYDRARWKELAELGLVALAADEDHGGMGGSSLDLALIGESIGKCNAPDPWIENGVLPALLLSHSDDADQLEAVLSGDAIATFAWAERGQRHSHTPAQMTAEAVGDGFTLSGEKTFVFGAELADLFIVTALIDGEAACFALPRDSEGLEVHPYRLADGSISGELKLTMVAASGNARLSIDAQGLAQIIADIRLLAAAELTGLGQRLLDDTIAYVKEREQFGVAIGSFQALQHRLVDCYSAIEQSRSMLYRAALGDRSDEPAWQRAASGAKAFIAQNVDLIAREAVQMHGGMGVTDELAIGHAMKRVLVLSQLFGDTDTNLAEYAEAA
ncbi:MAG: acyl-CoA dehydrogenase [Erythrobacter sp.]